LLLFGLRLLGLGLRAVAGWRRRRLDFFATPAAENRSPAAAAQCSKAASQAARSSAP